MKRTSTCLPFVLYACVEVMTLALGALYVNTKFVSTTSELRREHGVMRTISTAIPQECALLVQNAEADLCADSCGRCVSENATRQHDEIPAMSPNRTSALWFGRCRSRVASFVALHDDAWKLYSNRSHLTRIHEACASLRSQRKLLTWAREAHERALSETAETHDEGTTRTLRRMRNEILYGMLAYAAFTAVATCVVVRSCRIREARIRHASSAFERFVHDLKAPCASLRNAIECERFDLCAAPMRTLTSRVADCDDLFALERPDALRWNAIPNAKAHFRKMARACEELFLTIDGSPARFLYDDEGLSDKAGFMLDDARFTRAVHNMVSNARHSSKDARVVTLRIGLQDRTLVAEVTNAECARLDRNEIRRRAPTGIGTDECDISLFAVRKFLEEAGGSISVSRNHRAIAKVEMRVPVRAMRQDANPPPYSTTDAPCDASHEMETLPIVQHPYESSKLVYRVLIVEDDAIERALLQATLSRYERIEVTLAVDGSEALALCKDAPFDAILATRNMPDMIGRDFVRAVLREVRLLPNLIALMSADILEGDRRFVEETQSQKVAVTTIFLWDRTCGYKSLAQTVYETLQEQATALVEVTLSDHHLVAI